MWVSAGMAPLSLPKSGPTASYSMGRGGTCRIRRPTGPNLRSPHAINTSLGQEIRVETVRWHSRLDYLCFLRQRAASVLRSASNCRELLGSRAKEDGRPSLDLAGQETNALEGNGRDSWPDQSSTFSASPGKQRHLLPFKSALCAPSG